MQRKLTSEEMAFVREFVKEFTDGGSIHTTYSGRSMYGKTCFGFTVENRTELRIAMQFVHELKNKSFDDFADELLAKYDGTKTDSMGRKTILYFPHFEWNPEEDDQEDYDQE